VKNVDAIRLHVQGLLNSFREPKSHKIPRTLPFPPQTTLIGLAGAALGLSENTIWKECKGLGVAVVDISKASDLGGTGKAEDLVKYKKYKDSEIETSIFVRELLYKPEYMVYYTTENEKFLNRLFNAFLNPVYALSLGRDDELITIKSVEKANLEPLHTGEFEETILPFDPVEEGFEIDISNQRYFEPYSTVLLPSTFIVKNGVREPSGFRKFVFLRNLKITLTKEGGFTDGKYNFFLL
jgi:CRISPR-associated protein Cas5t